MYATVEQATSYISEHYVSTDSLRVQWEALTANDKQVLLKRAEQAIDQLPLLGTPLVVGKAFPREPFKDTSLLDAKVATIELAIQTQDSEAVERFKLQRQGVRSYRIGDLSESFGAPADQYKHSLSIVSPYLQKWLGGGYKICHTQCKG